MNTSLLKEKVKELISLFEDIKCAQKEYEEEMLFLSLFADTLKWMDEHSRSGAAKQLKYIFEKRIEGKSY